MKLNDNDIDNLFKEKAASSSFEYKDAYWKEMEAMLPKNNGKDFLWMATSGIFIALVSFTLFSTKQDGHNLNSTSVLADKSVEMTKEISQESTSNKSSKPLTNDSQNTLLSESNSTKSRTPSNKNNFPKVSQNNFSKENKTSFQQNSSGKKQDFQERIEQTNTNSSPIKSMVSFSETKNSERNQTLYSKQNIEELSTSVQQEEVSSGLTLSDLTLLPLQNEINSNAPLQSPLPVRSQFYAQLLGGISQSMVIPSSEINYNIGLGVGFQMNKGKFRFNTGLNGLWGFHNNLVLTRQAKVYSFGSETVKYELKYKEIFSLEAELSIGYQFSKHIIKVGVRPSYIVGTKVGYREEDETHENNENYFGLTKGIQLFGIKPMLGYTYLLKQDFSIGVNIGMQLMPLIDENFVVGLNRSFPIDGQIFIRKTIHFRR